MSNKHKSYYFYIDEINQKFPGLSKLVDHIKPVFGQVKVINSLTDVENEYEVIPLGTVAAYFYLKKYQKGGIAFIIDAYTLGFYSVARFYFKRGEFFNFSFYGALLRYVKYYFIEKKIINSFEKVIVVSNHDAIYLKNKFKCNNISVIPNGADMPPQINKENKQFNYTLGILSYWGASAIKDIDWFVKGYLPKLKKIYPNLNLITAGRGASADIIKYFQDNGIEYLGEIDDLSSFFDRIDIYITTLRKECGILNKVLDAMAYKKIVVGLPYNLYAFDKLVDGFHTYSNFDELVMVINHISSNGTETMNRTENAYNYILEYHNWSKNYHAFKSIVDNYHEQSLNNG